MDIKQLKYFLHVCKNKSLSETAKELYITEQGLSKSIKGLENEIGVPLFKRIGNKLVPTNYGVIVKNKSSHIVEEFDSFKNSIKKISSINKKRILIGYSLGILIAFNYDYIKEFKKKYPYIELAFTEYEDFFCEKAVLNEEVDIGLTIGPVDELKFNSRSILVKKLNLIVHERSSLSRNNEIDVKEIVGKEIICVNKNFKIYHNFANICNNAGFRPNIIYTTSDVNFMTYLSRVTGIPSIGVHFKDVPALKFLPFKDSYSIWEICLITKKKSFISESTAIFIKYISNLFKNKN